MICSCKIISVTHAVDIMETRILGHVPSVNQTVPNVRERPWPNALPADWVLGSLAHPAPNVTGPPRPLTLLIIFVWTISRGLWI
jgi:hypothetical protein